jgi:hypothetical protein
VDEAEDQQMGERSQGGDRRPGVGHEVGKGGHQRIGAVQGAERVVADPGPLTGELAVERSLLRAVPRLLVGSQLVHQRFAARQPRRIARHDQLDAGLLALAEEQEEDAAAEVGEHLGDQLLGGGAALGVGKHPFADAA